jgi:hypothetical protein
MYRIDIPEEDTPLAIPYYRDDPNSHSYVDLKLEPAREMELPELQKNSVLRDLVLTVNAQTCLQTFGCELWLTYPWTGTLWPEYTYRAGSYLDLSFTDDRRNNRGAYEQLIDDFIKTKTATPTTHVGFQHKSILTAPRTHLGIIWWNWGAGRTEEEANDKWEQGIRLFKEFVIEKYPLAK